MISVCVSSCRCYVLVSVVHPVAILSAVFCVICSLCLMLVVTIWWKRTQSTGPVMALYVARIVSFCSPMLLM